MASSSPPPSSSMSSSAAAVEFAWEDDRSRQFRVCGTLDVLGGDGTGDSLLILAARDYDQRHGIRYDAAAATAAMATSTAAAAAFTAGSPCSMIIPMITP